MGGQGGKRRNQCKVWTYNAREDRYEGISDRSMDNLALGPKAKRVQGARRRLEIGANAIAMLGTGQSKAATARALGVSLSTLARALAERPDPLLE
jgi:hypothetical protein